MAGGDGGGVPAYGRGPILALLALLVVYLALATAYNVVVPVFEAPDEHTHYFVAQHIARSGRLPVQPTDEEARGPWEQEGSQPPLYYLLVAPLVGLSGADLEADALWYNHQNTMGQPALVGNENRFVHDPAREGWPWHGYALAVHLARGLSTLLGLLTVVASAAIARRIVPGRPWLALGAAALVALNPQLLHVSAALSNDAAVIALAAATLALLLRVWDGHDDRRTVLALALTAGLAPLAKLSGLAVLGFTALTLLWLAYGRSRGDTVRWLVRTLGPVLVVALLVSGWWYARNWWLYGDPTGLSRMLPAGWRRTPDLGRWLVGLPAELRGVWYSTWGLFGWFTLLLPSWAYGSITALAGVGLLGLIRAGVRGVGWVRWRRFVWLLGWGALTWLSLLRWLTITKGGQGRLLFPALPVLAVMLVVGWRTLTPSRLNDRRLTAGVAMLTGALALYALIGVIRPAFAPPPTVAADAVPADAISVGVTFGRGLRLTAARLPDRVTEGRRFPVTLYWQPTAPITRDGFVALRLDQPLRAGDTGLGPPWPETLVSGPVHLSYPGGGTRPPALLRPQAERYVDHQRIRAPSLAGALPAEPAFGIPAAPSPPIEARLSVHLYDMAAAQRWSVTAGRRGDAAEWSTGVVIAPDDDALARQARALQAARRPLARFAGGLTLYPRRQPSADAYGWMGLEPVTVAPGEAGATGVLWTLDPAAHPPAVPLTVFVHLVGPTGTVATFDTPPATHGRLPTTRWRAGEVVPAVLRWEVPPDAVPGTRYVLRAGLYRPDGARLPAEGPDGPWPEHAVELHAVTVGRAEAVQRDADAR